MKRIFVLVSIFSFLIVFSTGCSFIKEQILSKFIHDSETTETTDQEKEKQRQESGPIPVNPQHS